MTNKLPLHTKIGTYVTVIVVVLLCFFLLRNCVSAVYYGVATDEKELTYYHDLGFEVGSKRDRGGVDGSEKEITNPFLLKVYQKGFREGRDSIRSTMKKEKNGKN